MTTVTVAITGENSLLGKFELEDASVPGTIVSSVAGVKNNTFEVTEGVKYYIGINVYGNNGEKYKIKISGASSASYPTSELTLDGGFDDIIARIVA